MLRKGLLTDFIKYWIKPPSALKRVVTSRDIKKKTGLIGGRQFAPINGTAQVFFWMSDNHENPKIGEYIYMRYEPDEKGNVAKIFSHIHYPISKNQIGEFEINKYYASTDEGIATDYRHQPVDSEELQDILIAARNLRNGITNHWGLDLS